MGRTLCAATVQRDWTTVSLSRSPSPHGTWEMADISLPLSTHFRPDVVVHAAARSSPWGSRREFERQNIQGTRNVVDFCERAGRPHLVYISTSAVLYRNEHQFGMTETMAPPERFLNEYARTKFAGERLVQGYAGPQTILRPRAVFGPGDTVVFPRLLRAAARGKFPRIESGQTVMADLIFIDTLVDYILRVIERKRTGLYHVTNNQPVPLVAFLSDVFARLGLPPPSRQISVDRALRAASCIEAFYRLLPFLGEPPITRFGVSVFAYSKTMDVTKALRDLDPPSVSLEEGVERFVASFRNAVSSKLVSVPTKARRSGLGGATG